VWISIHSSCVKTFNDRRILFLDLYFQKFSEQLIASPDDFGQPDVLTTVKLFFCCSLFLYH
jgi:hypothetical protein